MRDYHYEREHKQLKIERSNLIQTDPRAIKQTVFTLKHPPSTRKMFTNKRKPFNT